MKLRILVCVALLMVSGVGGEVAAQEAETTPCTSPEHSQFDFWIGEWKVTDRDGVYQGSNRIEKVLGGCVLQESWTGAKGTKGLSFNIYVAGRGVWHQTWVDASGTLLLLDGGLEDGRMVLSGATPAGDGKGEVRHEIAWTPMRTGQVKQVWRISKDGGETWNDAFVGIYTREE